MMKVLLTRPEGHNQSMVNALTEKGIDHWVTPLLCIETITLSTSDAQLITNKLSQSDIIICISANAVVSAAKTLGNAWPKAHYFAIGSATQTALANFGVTAIATASDYQHTEGLLTLSRFKHIKNKKITIIRGCGGREALAQQLRRRGANVNYWEVYRRTLPPLDGPSIAYKWQHYGIDTIVVTSGAVLDSLIELLPKKLFSWLQSCHMIVPSQRVAIKARTLGLTHITNANGANSQAVLNALKL